MDTSLIGLIHLVADIILVPLFGLVWNIQGRISRIEGYIHARRSGDNHVE